MCADRNASRRSDIAHVVQSLRRLRFPGISVAMPSETAYGHHVAAPCQIFLPSIFLPSVSPRFLRVLRVLRGKKLCYLLRSLRSFAAIHEFKTCHAATGFGRKRTQRSQSCRGELFVASQHPRAGLRRDLSCIRRFNFFAYRKVTFPKTLRAVRCDISRRSRLKIAASALLPGIVTCHGERSFEEVGE